MILEDAKSSLRKDSSGRWVQSTHGLLPPEMVELETSGGVTYGEVRIYDKKGGLKKIVSAKECQRRTQARTEEEERRFKEFDAQHPQTAEKYS